MNGGGAGPGEGPTIPAPAVMPRRRRSASSALAILLFAPVAVGAQASRAAAAAVEVTYAGDLYAPLRGGRTRDAVFLDNLDLALHSDLERLLGLTRTRIRVHVQSNRGRSISERVGDLQGLSNIEADSEWRLYELWLEHDFVPGRLSALAGVYDLNSEFDVIPGAAEFLNSSFGFGPEFSGSGVRGPSTYPYTTLGLRLKARPHRAVYVAISVMDGAPGNPDVPDRSRFALAGEEGALLTGEVGVTRPSSRARVAADPSAREEGGGRRIGRGRRVQPIATKLAVGAWAYTREFERWGSDGRFGRSRGIYGLAEQALLTSGGRELRVFARLGVANGAVNRLASYLGAGLVLNGPWRDRPDDGVGLAVARARNATSFVENRVDAGLVTGAETVLEVYYHLLVFDWFQIQPDIQWIIDPGTDATLDDALVLGVRGILSVDLP